ncbi:50S ribosomal protein L11 methyltransferase [Candidatus Microgenomates bacterium]|nr:50S ribosomal protein L11 methyltransferase [Candidatus Microgenomates bacterium]
MLDLIFILLIFFLILSFFTGAPYIVMRKKEAKKMTELAKIKKGERVYDLGSGDGRLVIMAAKKGARAIGYEINPFLVLISWVRILLARVRKNAQIKWRNFWGQDISDADVVLLYLITQHMERMEKKLLKELKPGARVISYTFKFPNWPHSFYDKENRLYVYEKKIGN